MESEVAPGWVKRCLLACGLALCIDLLGYWAFVYVSGPLFAPATLRLFLWFSVLPVLFVSTNPLALKPLNTSALGSALLAVLSSMLFPTIAAFSALWTVGLLYEGFSGGVAEIVGLYSQFADNGPPPTLVIWWLASLVSAACWKRQRRALYVSLVLVLVFILELWLNREAVLPYRVLAIPCAWGLFALVSSNVTKPAEGLGLPGTE